MAKASDTPASVRRAAMDLLARREHGRVELERKLLRRGLPQELIDTALARLTDEGLLNEERYLEAYIRSRSQSGYGPLRIREELQQRGLSRSDIEAALENSAIDWQALLHKLWQRKFAQLPQDVRERAQQGRFLSYRGFSIEAISRLLQGRTLDD